MPNGNAVPYIQNFFKTHLICPKDEELGTELLERSPTTGIPCIEMIIRHRGDILSIYYNFEKGPICKNIINMFNCRNRARRIKLKKEYFEILKKYLTIKNHWIENRWRESIRGYIVKNPYLNIQEKKEKIILGHTANLINNIYIEPLSDGIEISPIDRVFIDSQCSLLCITESANMFRGCNAIFHRFNTDDNCYQNSDISDILGGLQIPVEKDGGFDG